MIAVGSVVTKNVEPYTIVGGVPAKIIKRRFDVRVVSRLLELQWWNYGPNILKDIDLSNINELLNVIEIRKEKMKSYSCYKVELSGVVNNEIKIIDYEEDEDEQN